MKSLVQLAGCEKYHRLSQLNLLDTGSNRMKFFNRAVRYLVTDLEERLHTADRLQQL